MLAETGVCDVRFVVWFRAVLSVRSVAESFVLNELRVVVFDRETS